jgi:hypothetical protein
MEAFQALSQSVILSPISFNCIPAHKLSTSINKSDGHARRIALYLAENFPATARLEVSILSRVKSFRRT